MEISDLIDAAARAAVEHDRSQTASVDPAANVRLSAAIHDARQALASQGTLAAEAWDRGQQAREVIDRDGMTFADRFGQPKARPEIAIERDSRIGFARLIRELGLDVEPPPEAPRMARTRDYGSRA